MYTKFYAFGPRTHMHRILKGCTFTHKLKRQNTYRQIFQLQLTDCIVIFDVFRDEGKFEIGIFKDGVFLLSVRPILGTLNLKVHYTKKIRGCYWGKQGTQAEVTL